MEDNDPTIDCGNIIYTLEMFDGSPKPAYLDFDSGDPLKIDITGTTISDITPAAVQVRLCMTLEKYPGISDPSHCEYFNVWIRGCD